LRIEMRGRVMSLDPAEKAAETMDGATARLQLLVFDRLVSFDRNGQPQPALAISWQADPERKRWELRLRPGVKFHDGYPLTTAGAGGVLQRLFNSRAAVTASGDTIVIQADHPLPGLLADLARPTASIAARGPSGDLVGTGPFRVTRWDAGRRATLAAFEDHWAGRAYLDAIEIEMGRAPRDQLLDLQLGRADLVEMPLSEIRAAADRGRKTWTSPPVELIALSFQRTPPAEDARLREALALSIDRAAIHNVLLQRQGEITGAILPQWLSGYAFLFSTAADLARARQLAAEASPAVRTLALGYDASDGLARIIAERIAVNARDAGITLQVSPQPPRPDLRLLRLRIGGLDPARALADAAPWLGAPELRLAAEPYAAERALLDGFRVIPLFHLPEAYGVSAKVRTWLTPPLDLGGDLRLADIWLEKEKP
jgi:peptide/nickel transport system substrate-binding protein